jgi:hypothetical protein
MLIGKIYGEREHDTEKERKKERKKAVLIYLPTKYYIYIFDNKMLDVTVLVFRINYHLICDHAIRKESRHLLDVEP